MVDPVTFVPVGRVLSATDPSLFPARAVPTPAVEERPAAIFPPTFVTAVRNVAAQGVPVDAERVASLRAQIDQGTYQRDAARIADAMLNFVGNEQ